MQVDYPTILEAATPEYVLLVLRDQHRQQCRYDPEAEPTELTFDSSVAEWREACDLVAWRKLARALNDMCNVSIPDRTWRWALEPSLDRTLRGVCELLAQHSKRLVVRPARLLGSSCETAGVFLTVRSLLHDAGAISRHIKPSDPLAPYTRRFPEVFLGPVSALSPGALPLVRIHTPFLTAMSWMAFVGILASVVGHSVGAATVAFVGCAAAAVAILLMMAAARMPPSAVEFGDLRTFRELAEVIGRRSRA